jgi:Putative lumazine-binding
MHEGRSDEDVAAVTEVVRLYYEGMMTGDEAKLSRAFHPRQHRGERGRRVVLGDSRGVRCGVHGGGWSGR